jgi:hypothetical protein
MRTDADMVPMHQYTRVTHLHDQEDVLLYLYRGDVRALETVRQERFGFVSL